MAEPPGFAETRADRAGRSASTSPPPRPRWVKVSAVLALIAVVILVVVLLAGGGRHGPGRHAPGGGDRQHQSGGQAPGGTNEGQGGGHAQAAEGHR